MHSSQLLGLVFLMLSSAACLDTEMVGPEGAGHENYPFHAAVFDHPPTEAELQADLAQFLATASGEAGVSMLVTPTGEMVPGPGQKLVRIDATTSNILHAGTDSAAKVRFSGVWQSFSLQQFSEVFVLNNLHVGDLDQNTISTYYYLINLGQYLPGLTQDRFMMGQISNSSQDGWHCNNLAVFETNHSAATRIQSLPFNQWVDSPSPATSSWMFATDTTWLAYN